MAKGTGRCLCGAVTFSAMDINEDVGACHCGMCRKWGGGPLMAAECGPEVSFTGGENITVYDSSKWAERGFCKKCGSHLFYRFKDSGAFQIPVGLFDEQENFRFTLQVYIDRKPSFYSFQNKTEEMTEKEVIDMFAPDKNT